MAHRASTFGFSILSFLILVVISIPFIRDGFKILKLYYEFYELQAQLAQLARVANTLDKNEVEMRVRELFRDFETVTFDDVSISWTPRKTTFEAQWTATWNLNFYGYNLYSKKLKFRIFEETPDG